MWMSKMEIERLWTFLLQGYDINRSPESLASGPLTSQNGLGLVLLLRKRPSPVSEIPFWPGGFPLPDKVVAGVQCQVKFRIALGVDPGLAWTAPEMLYSVRSTEKGES